MLRVYTINQETKAILYKRNLTNCTWIFEGKKQQPTTNPLMRILNQSCLENGSSLKGRLDYAKKILQTSSKLPIAVSPLKRIFMVPIRSLRNKETGVISYYHIKRYIPLREQRDQTRTLIIFKDGTDLSINVSYPSFKEQYSKTGHLIASYFAP